jgi:hypothetical protein
MNSLSEQRQTGGGGGDANHTRTLPEIVKQCIVAGTEKAYQQEQVIKAHMGEPPASITEYLITGCIAKELWTEASLTPERNIVVQVECSATDFVNNAFEGIKFNPCRRRKNHKTKRKGRIDIALLRRVKHLGFRSVVGIELKGFNPPVKSIRADLERLIHAMKQTDSIGENSIVSSFCAFVMSLKKKNELLNVCEIKPRNHALQKKLERELKGIPRKNSSLQKVIHIWNIDVDGSDEVARRTPEEIWDQNDIASASRAVVGVLVSIEQKNASAETMMQELLTGKTRLL